MQHRRNLHATYAQPTRQPTRPLLITYNPRVRSFRTVIQSSWLCHASVTRRYYIGEKRSLSFFRTGRPMRELPTSTLPLASIFDTRSLPRAEETVTAQHRLQVTWARTDDELREAQRLRYRVFADEMGARLTGPAGLDVDAFDSYCDHLLVRDLDTLKVVGTYRALPPHQAARVGRLYAESEFNVSRLTHLRPKMVEVGRSCVHPDYRSGAVIMSLWGGLAAYMMHHRYEDR